MYKHKEKVKSYIFLSGKIRVSSAKGRAAKRLILCHIKVSDEELFIRILFW